jgi:menaquinone-dependent protoporphyrinogen oxidase
LLGTGFYHGRMSNSKKILVAYGTKHGATRDIAERIGRTLREAGLTAEVLPSANAPDLSGYDAVVLGSGVYIGRWRKDAAKLLKQHEQELATKPIWLFSSGPTGKGDPVELTQGWRFPNNLQDVSDRVKPRGVTVFHGAIDSSKLNLLEKRAVEMVKALHGDFRDWDAVEA